MDAEDVRKVVAAQLASQAFNDVLRDVWLEKGEAEADIVYPVAISPGLLWQPQHFPSGEVSIPRGIRFNPDTQHLEFDYIVDIYWHVNGMDELTITDHVARLLRATQDFYSPKANLLPAGVASLWVGDEDYSPFIRWNDDNRPLVQSGLQTIGVKVIR